MGAVGGAWIRDVTDLLPAGGGMLDLIEHWDELRDGLALGGLVAPIVFTKVTTAVAG